jgi:ribosomal protein L7/L12
MTIMTDLFNAYDNATDKIVKKHLALALRRAMILYTQEGVGNKYSPNTEEIRLGRYESKIAAIKAYRTRTGTGLLDAKNAIEDYFKTKGFTFYYADYSNNF